MKSGIRNIEKQEINLLRSNKLKRKRANLLLLKETSIIENKISQTSNFTQVSMLFVVLKVANFPVDKNNVLLLQEPLLENLRFLSQMRQHQLQTRHLRKKFRQLLITSCKKGHQLSLPIDCQQSKNVIELLSQNKGELSRKVNSQNLKPKMVDISLNQHLECNTIKPLVCQLQLQETNND